MLSGGFLSGAEVVVNVTDDEHHTKVIYTIGHSTRKLDEFIDILKAYGIQEVIDVRTVPRSRHNPQFNMETLPSALKEAGVDYVHVKGLGGLRRARANSPNMAWRNASFRGYADYMQTDDFKRSLREVVELASQKTMALMCAEAVPWRCHRYLIADALVAQRIRVEHILATTSTKAHQLNPLARVEDGAITYPSLL